MRPYDIILKKRDGHTLNNEEIAYFLESYNSGVIPDYQMAALAMAVFYRGLNEEETASWTEALVNSGEKLDLSPVNCPIVDKHSTGGVGDTTSLVLMPLVASAGVPFVKISGRGLGHTGGTVDKLGAIPGFQTTLDTEGLVHSLKTIGVAFTEQTANLVPADKKLYSLRDATATVDSLPLIASSVVSKKIATGAHGILLDVKAGSGSFMKTVQGACELGREMMRLGTRLDLRIVVAVTYMDQPLGRAVGNSLEVRESLEVLKGRGPEDIRELCLVLGSHMLVLAGKCRETARARKILETNLEDGTALEKYRQLISNQGGSKEVVHDYSLLPQAGLAQKIYASRSGYVQHVHAGRVGSAVVMLGAGRSTVQDSIDPSVGVVLHKKAGEAVCPGEVVAEIHGSSRESIAGAEKVLREAFTIGDTPPSPFSLVHEIMHEIPYD